MCSVVLWLARLGPGKGGLKIFKKQSRPIYGLGKQLFRLFHPVLNQLHQPSVPQQPSLPEPQRRETRMSPSKGCIWMRVVGGDDGV